MREESYDNRIELFKVIQLMPIMCSLSFALRSSLTIGAHCLSNHRNHDTTAQLTLPELWMPLTDTQSPWYAKWSHHFECVWSQSSEFVSKLRIHSSPNSGRRNRGIVGFWGASFSPSLPHPISISLSFHATSFFFSLGHPSSVVYVAEINWLIISSSICFVVIYHVLPELGDHSCTVIRNTENHRSIQETNRFYNCLWETLIWSNFRKVLYSFPSHPVAHHQASFSACNSSDVLQDDG